MSLAPCPSCRRHVAVHERTCPFCDGALADPSSRPIPSARLSRAALMMFTTLGVMTVGCPKTQDKDPETIAQPYGAPPRPDPPPEQDAGVDASGDARTTQ